MSVSRGPFAFVVPAVVLSPLDLHRTLGLVRQKYLIFKN